VSVYKFSNAGGFGTYQRYNDFLAGNPAVIQDAGAYFPLGEFTLASAQSSVTFSNIPQTYTHLQLRILTSGSGGYSRMRFNGSSATAYAGHYLYGNGASVFAGAETSGDAINFGNFPNSSTSFGAYIVDILDYKSTNKNKTTRALEGYDLNGSGLVLMHSGVWYATPTAITSITVLPNSSTYNINSHFALYGVLA
jgi:hypothetical protein